MIVAVVSGRMRWTPGRLVAGAALAAWVAVADLWVKLAARWAGCGRAPSIDLFRTVYDDPGDCSAVPIVHDAISLHAIGHVSLHGAIGSIVGLILLACTSIVTILVARWRFRSAGDSLALGALWGGAVVLAWPCMMNGWRLTELRVGPIATGIGDLALVWAIAWISWRAIAEARA